MIYTTFLKSLLQRHFGEPPPAPSGREGAGLVIVLDGVGGLDLLGTSMLYVGPAGGLPYEIRVVPWGHGFGRWFADLTRVKNQQAQALAIAKQVEDYRTQNPGSRVFVVAKSGGAGVAVRLLEDLPDDSVEVTVLVAPALSPGYNLVRALRAVRREIVVFWSPLDMIILGLGTLVFGTIDRVHCPAAGFVGFRVPRTLDDEGRALYSKLRHVRWHPRMARTLYMGGHVGPDSPFFLRKYVVPLLQGEPVQEHSGESQAEAVPRR
jgi:pimeloyl-ACP methyl ester carboxylesterase